ncbi:kinase-like protein [Thelephora ganbajun]|uniref:Kinase-like protein n=1 Tax=Thelephora ganbajun TaxID=370292 RepID=A0ACB6ZW77_THEGA|nr:kinase-like protein [Thelephora ganbajun]
MDWSIRATFATGMAILSLCQFFRSLYRPRNRRAGPRREKIPTTYSSDATPFRSPPDSTRPSKPNQHESQSYYDLAQRLRRLLPLTFVWLGLGDIQFIATTPFSSGGFSEVWQGSLQGSLVAVKSLRCYSSLEFNPAEIGLRFLKEVWASSQLSHPNIVPFLGVYSTPSHPFALLYEMMDNLDLGRYLTQRSNVSRLKLLTEISRAMKYMHSTDVVHGNIKMKNVLVDKDGVARLGGLGSAFTLSLPASWADVDAERLFCGIAPELINPQAFGLVHARTTKATDVFAFGMLAWEVFEGKPPFAGKIEAAVILSVFQNNRPLRPVHPEVSDRVWAMIQRCWDRDPFRRMAATDIVDLLEAET